MFQQGFLHYYQLRCQNIRQHVFMARTYFDPDGIHDLRVEIKQLRAFFRLIEWMTPTFRTKKYIKNIRKLFKSAANLRDIHVQQMLAREWVKLQGVFLSEYYNLLKHKELSARIQFADFIEHFDLEEELAKNEKRLTRAILPLSHDHASAKVQERIAQLLQQILAYRSEQAFREKDLHQLRILTKETRYTLEITKQGFPELEDHTLLIKHLRGLHQALGEWHDGVVALKHVNDFQAEFCCQFAEPLFTETSVYNKLSQTIQQEKTDHLSTFEERWDEFIGFLDSKGAGHT